MARKDGTWYCDVCDNSIPVGQKRYPLDGGRICCPDCWQEIKTAGVNGPTVVVNQPSPEQPVLLYPVARWSGFAIASFVLSLLGLPICPSDSIDPNMLPTVVCLGLILHLLAFIFGIIGLNQTGKAGRRGRALAIVALIITVFSVFVMFAELSQ